MIDWIDEKCKVWGKAVRKRLIERKNDHQEGWPSVSILGKIKEEWEGAGHRSTGATQRIFAGYTGDALDVHRAIFHPQPMPFDLYATLKVHYCIRAPAKSKVLQLQLLLGRTLSVSQYWHTIDNCHYFLSARMCGLDDPVMPGDGEKSVATK